MLDVITGAFTLGRQPEASCQSKHDYPLQAQYKDYVTAIVLRKNSLSGTVYRDDPTILAWDVANEPSNPGDDSGDVLQVRPCQHLSFVLAQMLI